MIQFAPIIMSGASSFLGAMANKEAGEAGAKSERRAAVGSKIAGYFKNRILRRSQAEIQSTIRARAGAVGLDVTQGSPLDAYLQATRETEMDIIHARSTADSEYNAHLDAANNALRTGNAASGAAIVQGTSDVARMKYESLLPKKR